MGRETATPGLGHRCRLPGRSARRAAAGLVSAALAASAGAAWAQLGGGAATLNTLALGWTRGQYVAPLMCEIDGAPRRGGRRIVIGPGPRHARPPTNRIHFVSLQVEKAKRCFTEFGGEEFEVTGNLEIALPGRSRPDTASREFSSALRRDRGFDFEVRSGVLQIQPVGDGSPRAVDFRGGQARLREVAPGSDAARLLAEYPGRQLTLELEAPDGTALRYRMVQAAGR